MTYLIIWIGQEIDEARKKCIRTIINTTKESDKIIFISEKKFFKNSKITYIDYDNFVIDMLKDDEIIRNFWDIIKDNSKLNYVKSDIIRFYYASKYEKIIYCDADIKLKKPIIIDDENECYFAQNGRIKNYCLFYNGIQLSEMKNFLQYCIHMSYKNAHFHLFKTRLWMYRYLQDKNYKVISTDYFEHLTLLG